MKDLYIDLDILNSTHEAMKGYYEDLDGYLDRFDTAIEALRGPAWESEASKEFFATYDESWKKDINLFLEIVGQMRDGLKHIIDKYTEINDKKPFNLPSEY